MDLIGKKRAINALLSAKTYTHKFFPYVYVVGSHVYFSLNAAKLQQQEYELLYSVSKEVEVVYFEEAVKASGLEFGNLKEIVDHNIYRTGVKLLGLGNKKIEL